MSEKWDCAIKGALRRRSTIIYGAPWKYKNIHTDDSCILRGFFNNLGYLWSLKVATSILFQRVLLCKDILAGKGTQRNLWDESAAPAAPAPDLAGKKIPTITPVPCPEMCFHLSKPSREVWTAWGCGKEERTKIIAISTELLSVVKAQTFYLVSYRQRTPFLSQGSNSPNKTDRQFHCG